MVHRSFDVWGPSVSRGLSHSFVVYVKSSSITFPRSWPTSGQSLSRSKQEKHTTEISEFERIIFACTESFFWSVTIYFQVDSPVQVLVGSEICLRNPLKPHFHSHSLEEQSFWNLWVSCGFCVFFCSYNICTVNINVTYVAAGASPRLRLQGTAFAGSGFCQGKMAVEDNRITEFTALGTQNLQTTEKQNNLWKETVKTVSFTTNIPSLAREGFLPGFRPSFITHLVLFLNPTDAQTSSWAETLPSLHLAWGLLRCFPDCNGTQKPQQNQMRRCIKMSQAFNIFQRSKVSPVTGVSHGLRNSH